MSDSDSTISSGSTDNEEKKPKSQYNKGKFLRKPCSLSCPLECTKHITEPERQQILQYFHSLPDINVRRMFVQKSVRRVYADSSNPSLEFYFTINGKRIPVCRIFFLATLSIQIHFIQRALEVVFDDQVHQVKKKQIETGGSGGGGAVSAKNADKKKVDTPRKTRIVKKIEDSPKKTTTDISKKTDNESSKVDPNIVDHIKSIPRIIVPSVEGDQTIYTEFSINVDTMFDLYVKYCKKRNLLQGDFSRYKKLFEQQNTVFRECQKSLPLFKENDMVIVRLE